MLLAEITAPHCENHIKHKYYVSGKFRAFEGQLDCNYSRYLA
jgi:hypothetical protein